MAPGAKGSCYLCGAKFAKNMMKKHIMEEHAAAYGGDQACYLLKIESTLNRDYWIYADVPVMSAMKRLDSFLREIWLECCGHMSAFYRQDRTEIYMGNKVGKLPLDSKVKHEYDFGSPTESTVTVEGRTKRKRQVKAVRLLARNAGKTIACAVCGQPAGAVCTECISEGHSPYLCEACLGEHVHSGTCLPITNSPRMGVCAYDGAADVYAFDPEKIEKSTPVPAKQEEPRRVRVYYL